MPSRSDGRSAELDGVLAGGAAWTDPPVPSAAREEIDRVGGPVVLLGHSFGGMVVTEAGAHPDVKHLVYLCAFMPDTGESLVTLVSSVEDPGLKAPVHTLPGEREGEVLINPEFARGLFYADATDNDV